MSNLDFIQKQEDQPPVSADLIARVEDFGNTESTSLYSRVANQIMAYSESVLTALQERLATSYDLRIHIVRNLEAQINTDLYIIPKRLEADLKSHSNYRPSQVDSYITQVKSDLRSLLANVPIFVESLDIEGGLQLKLNLEKKGFSHDEVKDKVAGYLALYDPIRIKLDFKNKGELLEN